MINTRACDCCHTPLDNEVVQFERLEGSVVFLSHQRWSIEPRPGGLRLFTICRTCGDYLAAAVEHLRASFAVATDAAEAAPERVRRAG